MTITKKLQKQNKTTRQKKIVDYIYGRIENYLRRVYECFILIKFYFKKPKTTNPHRFDRKGEGVCVAGRVFVHLRYTVQIF